MASVISLAESPWPSAPSQATRMVPGTSIQVSPVTSTAAISVAPRPNMKQPNAPPVGEWAVAADHEHAGAQVAALGQHHVADALHVIEVPDAVLGHPAAREVEDLGALGIDGRHEMVGHHNDLVRVPNADTQALEDGRDPARPA